MEIDSTTLGPQWIPGTTTFIKKEPGVWLVYGFCLWTDHLI